MQQNTKRQLTRDEIAPEYKWRLDELYESVDAWNEAIANVERQMEELAAYQGRLAESAETLYNALQLSDAMGEQIGRIYAYAMLHLDTDTTNQEYQGLNGRAQDVATRASTAGAFMTPEILAIPDEQLDGFLAASEPLRLYAHSLDDTRRMKPHVLSAKEEALLAQASELARAPQTVFGMVNNADMKFPTVKDDDGDDIELTHGRYIRLLKSRNRSVRQQAFEALYATYAKQANTIASLLNASVKKDVFYARVRNYESSLAAALHSNNIPVTVYDNLTETIRANLHLMHRYVSLRKKALQVDELHMWDLYAPIVPDVDFNIPFAEAKQLMIDGLAPLGDDYISVLKDGMESGWLDVYESVGKRAGAYSLGIYGHHPYVLLNHEDNLDSAFTLAHELGHAMHSYYSSGTQPYPYSRYTIFLAEVASTVNESLLMDHMLKTTDDKLKRMFLINHYLDQFRGTVFRQTMFAEFERWMHNEAQQGKTLTPALLNEQYRQLNVDYQGPDMIIDEPLHLEWARIPHFYRAFYVYQYATGFSAATAISKQILAGDDGAVDRYLAFLKTGSSAYSLDLLREAGVDMTTPEPIQAGMDVFASLLDEMEALLG